MRVPTLHHGVGSYSCTSYNTISLFSNNLSLLQVVARGQRMVKIAMRPRNTNLDSVVAVGFVAWKQKDVTGAISSVNAGAIKNFLLQNVADALQGRVAGVEVIKASREPGASSQIIIRGVYSLNQTNPLYVIDAGGVIIITTKRGLQGARPVVNFSARYGITTPRVPDLSDKNDFVQFKLLTRDQYYSNLTQEQIDTLPDVNRVKELYNNGTEENYNLSLSTPTINYFASGVYNKQKGVFLDNRSELAGARINTDFKIWDGIRIGEQLNVWKRNTTPVKTEHVSTPFRTVPTCAPYSGNPDAPGGGFPNYQAPNLIAQIKMQNLTSRKIISREMYMQR